MLQKLSKALPALALTTFLTNAPVFAADEPMLQTTVKTTSLSNVKTEVLPSKDASKPLESAPKVETTTTTETEVRTVTPLQTKTPTRPKLGLALGGGGTRGLAHIGVLRVLEREGVKIDYIAGTSMGAIVGGFYAAGMSLDDIEKLFSDKSLIKAFDTVPIPVRVALIPIFFMPHLVGYHPYDGLYKGNKFATFINEQLPKDGRAIETFKIPFAAVATNLLDGQAYPITTGNVGRALQASSAIPALRRPVPWQGKLFVDGGVINNVPVTQCRDMGADIVVAVDVDENLEELSLAHFRKIGSVGNRCLNMNLAKLDAPQIEKADIVIHPNVTGIQLLSRSLLDIKKTARAGEKAAENALPEIQQRVSGKLCDSETGHEL